MNEKGNEPPHSVIAVQKSGSLSLYRLKEMFIMKYRKAIAFMSALMLMASAFSCGKSDSVSDSEVQDAVSTENVSSTDTSQDSSKQKTTGTTSAKSDSSKTTTTTSTSSADTTDTSNSASGGSSGSGGSSSGRNSSNSSSQNKSSSGSDSGSSSGSSSGGSSGTNSGSSSSSGSGSSSESGSSGSSSSSSGSGNSSKGVEPEPVTTPSSSDLKDDEIKTYTAEVKLGSSTTFTGDNVSVSGSTVKITGAGDYIFTGKLSDGQIYVDADTEDKVTLVLNGVDINCSYGPAILINQSKKCTVKVKEGSVNNLSDSVKDKAYDGVIFSNDTIRIKGKGTLNINAGNAHGIASDDDVIFENSVCNITSNKSGIHANDNITISGGTLSITAGSNGLKSKDSITICGGTSFITGGKKDSNSAIYAAGAFDYTDGILCAAGNAVTAPTSSAYPYAVVEFAEAVSSGTQVSFLINGDQKASFAPQKDYRRVILLTPEASSGSKLTVRLGDVTKGEFTLSSGSNTCKVG